MKIRKGYVLRQVADSYMAVPVGEEANKRRGVIALNETGFRIWEELKEERTQEELVDKLKPEYDIPEAELKQNVVEFIGLLKEKELLE